MDYNELKILWNSEKDSLFFEFDEKGFTNRIVKENRRFNRGVFVRDAGDILIGLMVFSYFIHKGSSFALEGGSLERAFTLTAIGILFLALSSYRLGWTLIKRRSRLRYESSLRSQIDKSIDDLRSEIRLLRSSKWTFALILLIIPLFSYNIGVDESNFLLGIGVGASLLILAAVGFYLCRRKIYRELLPKKEEFESVRAKLLELDSD